MRQIGDVSHRAGESDHQPTHHDTDRKRREPDPEFRSKIGFEQKITEDSIDNSR